MNPVTTPISARRSIETTGLSPATSSFALAAAAAVLFNTALAWAKDAYAPLNSFMKSLTGHHWITHGLADLIVFIGLGLLFRQMRTAEKMDPNRVIRILVIAAAAASLGLGLWYVFF